MLQMKENASAPRRASIILEREYRLSYPAILTAAPICLGATKAPSRSQTVLTPLGYSKDQVELPDRYGRAIATESLAELGKARRNAFESAGTGKDRLKENMLKGWSSGKPDAQKWQPAPALPRQSLGWCCN
jgi:hypothetical protein